MQISAKQRLLRLAAGSVFAAGTVLIPATVAGAKPAPPVPELPTDPEGLPVPIPDSPPPVG